MDTPTTKKELAKSYSPNLGPQSRWLTSEEIDSLLRTLDESAPQDWIF